MSGSALEGPDVFFLKIDLDAVFLQLPDGGQGVDRVPRKAADRLGDDQVDLAVHRIRDHAFEALAMLGAGARDKLMRFADIISNNMNPRTTYNGNADMTAVVSTIQDGQTQWLVVADRDTNNYQPVASIPIGEMQYDKRMVNAWAADDELLLDVPRLKREKVLFKDVIAHLPKVTSPEQLYFPLGRTPNGKDLIEDLGQMPHMLVGGSTGSGKSVFLFTMLAAMLMTHPTQDELQLVLSSSKLEDFIHFEGLPHLYSGSVISDAVEATRVIKDVIFEESERRGKLLAEARVANITEYNNCSS